MIKKLYPHPEEIIIAQNTLISCKKKLPPRIIKKLLKRNNVEKHPINCIQCYLYPVGISPDSLQQMKSWGICYAELLEKIAQSFFSKPDGYIKKFFNTTLLPYLPPWQKNLIYDYKTCNHLAGAHLGDDHFNGRSIEWNIGAVGGLEEGSGSEEEISHNLKKKINNVRYISQSRPHSPCIFFKHHSHPVKTIFIDTNSIKTVMDALLYSYKSFCISNLITPKAKPLTAYIEHDDIYYSSVRSVRRLMDSGVKIRYTFHHTLNFTDEHLRTANGEIIDLVYLDCHLEDLHQEHPIIEAVRKNRVALDTSPFARLILRSKTLMALLSTPECHKALKLNEKEIEMIRRHLAHSVLLNRYSPALPSHHFDAVKHLDHNISHDYPKLNNNNSPMHENRIKPYGCLNPFKKKVIKIAMGSVFGGNGVMVFPPETPITEIINTFKPLKNLISRLALECCPMSDSDIISFTIKVEVKALFTEIFKTSVPINPLTAINKMKKEFYKNINTELQKHGTLCYNHLEFIIKKHLFSFIDENFINGKLLERLLIKYLQLFIEKTKTQNLPVVVQDFIEPDILNGEKKLGENIFISHRIHVLFTSSGKKVFISGSQLFSMNCGKQDNKHKMTCALVNCINQTLLRN